MPNINRVKNPYPRVRSRGVLTSPANATEWAKDVNCSTPSFFLNYTYSPGAKLGETEVMNDIVTPGFAKRSAAGEVIITPMSKSRTVCTSSCTYGGAIQTVANSCSSPAKKGIYETRGDILGYRLQSTGGILYPDALITDADVASLMTEAGTQCRANLSANSKNDLVESAAQAYSLGLPLISRAKSVHLWLNKYERLVQTGHDTASAWLQLRYGLLPTIADMQAILNGMSAVPRRDRKTFRGSATMRLQRVDTVDVGGTVLRMLLKRNTTDEVTVRATTVAETFLDGLSEVGLTPGNLVTLPWNLIPASFVVDWFTNVADYLQASVPALTSGILGDCTVTKRTRQVQYSVANTYVVGTSYTLVSPANGQFTSLYETKNRIASLSSPGLVIRGDFRLDNLIRITDTLALFASRVGTVFRDPISGRRRM